MASAHMNVNGAYKDVTQNIAGHAAQINMVHVERSTSLVHTVGRAALITLSMIGKDAIIDV